MCIINSNFEQDWIKESESASEIVYKANFTVSALDSNGHGYAKVKRFLSNNIFENNLIHVSIEYLSIKNELEKLGNTATGRFATGVGVSYLGQVETKIREYLQETLQAQINGEK